MRVGFCVHLPPYQYVDDNDIPTGAHIEMMDVIAKQSGFEVEYLPFETQTDAVEALASGTVDIVLGVSVLDRSTGNLEFTDIFNSSSLSMFARANANDAAIGAASINFVSIEYSDFSLQYFSGRQQNYSYFVKSNQKEVLDAMLTGSVDQMIGNRDTITWYLDKMGLSEQYTAIFNYISARNYYMAVRASDRYLKYTLNRGIADLIGSGESDAILENWLIDDASLRLEKILQTALTVCGIILFTAVAFFIAGRLIRRSLEREVAAKTESLNKANYELAKQIEQVGSDSRLRSQIIEASPAAILVFGKDDRIHHMNQAALDLGHMDCCTADLCTGDVSPFNDILSRLCSNFTRKEEISCPQTVTVKTNEGEYRQYRCNLHPIQRYGTIESYILMVEDVTVEEKEKQTIAEKEKVKAFGTIIAGIAHEIKNPLTAISASASIIESKGDSVAFRRAFAQHIPQEIERINRLLRNLIDYAKPPASTKEVVSIAKTVQLVCFLSSPLLPPGQLCYEIPDQNPLLVIGQLDEFKQALMNIILNAIESVKRRESLDQGTYSVCIKAFAENETIMVQIRDAGNGMDADTLRRCTEAFFTTKQGGTGIGLSLTQQYITGIGGKMVIASVAGDYTQITISLPRAAENKEI